ncbi:Cupredoxin [Xylogone sp. PMI_703]|nr:Cupredoxin [Xylogone sp. PMI_703]
MKWAFFGIAALAAYAVRATNFDVNVGQGGKLVFNPATVTAQVGDTLTYHFFGKNHSVVQSSFADPCHPLSGGFFSGFTPVPPNENGLSRTTFTITVNDTKPIWVYCGQTVGNHCQSGMVHAINAPSSGNTFDAFVAKAKTASTSTVPGINPIGGLRQTNIDVGPGGNLTFFPPNITELVGTQVVWTFNPKNHSVVQSSFNDPCHPLPQSGFSSGFVSMMQPHSGVTFTVTIEDEKPIWYYCAQTTKNHCQSGMVGSINAPATGNTFDAFVALAQKASLSSIPPDAPLVGDLKANGTEIIEVLSIVFDADNFAAGGDGLPPGIGAGNNSTTSVPPPSAPYNTSIGGSGGGGPPTNYSWGDSLSNEAVEALTFLIFIDNLLLDLLAKGSSSFSGNWANLYPQTIVDSMNIMTSQSYVHRYTSAQSLSHYKKAIPDMCTYDFPIQTIDEWAGIVLIVLNIAIAAIIEIEVIVAASDPWLIPILSSALGAKARTAALVNMMHSNAPAPAVREAVIAPNLAYSYLWDNYVVPGSCKATMPYTVLPKWTITKQTKDASNRVIGITPSFPSSINTSGSIFIAWWGPYGAIEYTPFSNGQATVPADLYGYVWATVTNTTSASTMSQLADTALTAPNMVWVTGPTAMTW